MALDQVEAGLCWPVSAGCFSSVQTVRRTENPHDLFGDVYWSLWEYGEHAIDDGVPVRIPQRRRGIVAEKQVEAD